MLTAAINEEGLIDLLTQGRNRAVERGRRVLVSLTQPLQGNLGALDVFLNALPERGCSMFWSKPASGFCLAGSGAAAFLTAAGENRFDIIKKEYSEILDSALIQAPSIRGVGPIFMGGFRYDTKVKRDEFWHDFPDALLILPRFVLTSSDSETWLTVNAVIEPDTEIDLEAEVILNGIPSVNCRRVCEVVQPQVFRLAQSTKADWRNRVNAALKMIQGGELTKVVLSRRKVLHAGGKFLLDVALQRLCTEYPECAVFAIHKGDTAFIGASPEELACIEQGKLSVACLASSTARGTGAEEDARLQDGLFESRKERAEHSAVTSVVAEEIKELCTELDRDAEPRPMKLKNIQHLLTCFNGMLKDGISILDVIRRLHPTPAVAGVPTDRGLKLINDLEGDRGWYAAPVGWLDRYGEGEFAVGIRSALVDGSRAFLYAGCGIVAGSDPEREFAETELKFEPMLNALGYEQNVL